MTRTTELAARESSMAKPRILVVEDDEGLCSQYQWGFAGFTVDIAHSRLEAITAARRGSPPVILLDLGLPSDPDGVSEGFATLSDLTQVVPYAKIIVITGNGEKSHALKAIGMGASDFCEKPINLDVLKIIVDRALRLYGLEGENRRLASVTTHSPIARIVTASASMLKVCRDIERLAHANVPVLLLGESGTGKEALASALHELGPRAKHPFVAINCGAIPENLLESELFGHERGAFTGAVKQSIGKVELANRGTLFLDEVGDLPYTLQVKLLRFLQDQVVERVGGRQKIQVDVRVVSATNADIDERIAQGVFREDLYYRMNTVAVKIPALRDRSGDSLLLARFFLARFNQEFGRTIRGFTGTAAAAIQSHSWPGNVRELENRVKRAVIMADGRVIDVADIGIETVMHSATDLDLRAARMRAERDVIQAALVSSNNRLTVASKLLGVSRPTLYGLLEAHGLNIATHQSERLRADARTDCDSVDQTNLWGS